MPKNTSAALSPTSKIAKMIFELQCTIKLYHWNTKIYAYHVASDKLVDEITKLGDQLIETMVIRYGLPESIGNNIKCAALNDKEIVDYLQKHVIPQWTTEFSKLVKEKDSDLYSIRDDILAAINQTLYLLSFHSA